jgi:Colicin V production protein
MILDIALLTLGIIAIATGYNRGALATVFSIVGYVGGGVAGFAAANWYTSEWKGIAAIIALHLFGIFAGASIGRWILEKTGIGIHKRILFGPFKILNAIGGAALSLVQAAIAAFVIITLIDYLPWQIPHSIIKESKVYQEISDFNLLSFQISDLLRSTSLRLDQLKS